MRIALAGDGAFVIKHLDALARIDGVQVSALVGRTLKPTKAIADRYQIPYAGTDLTEVLADDTVNAVILCTPTQLHASQAIAALRAGKHVEVDIPIADDLADAEEPVKVQAETDLVAMAGHTRRFNPSHQWIHQRIGNRAPGPRVHRRDP